MGIVDDIKMQMRRPNNLVLQLIIVNVVIWLFYVTLALLGTFSGTDFFNGVNFFIKLNHEFEYLIIKPWTIITYGFLHDPFNPFHIIGNIEFYCFPVSYSISFKSIDYIWI